MPSSLQRARSVLLIAAALFGCVGQPRTTPGASGGPAAASALSSPADSAATAPTPPEPFAKLRSQREEAAFVSETTQASRLPMRAAARAWLSAAEGEGSAAQQFLVNSAELSIVPILEQPVPSEALRSVQALQLVVAAELTARARVAQKIRELLVDRRAVPSTAKLRGAEVAPPAHRVADEAYIAMRRSSYFPEPRAQSLLAQDRFYEASEAVRDATIAAAEKSGDWRTLAVPSGAKHGAGQPTLMH